MERWLGASLNRWLFGTRRRVSRTVDGDESRVFPLAVVALIPLNTLGMVIAFGMVAGGGSAHLAGYLLVVMAILNAVLGTIVVARIRPGTAVVNRRQHVRLLVEVEAALDGTPCKVQDLSLGGARVLVEDGGVPSFGEETTLRLDLSGVTFELRCIARRRLEHGLFTRVGLEFMPDQQQHIADLAFAMLSESPAEADDVTIGVAA